MSTDVLVIEDADSLRQVLGVVLQAEGFGVDLVGSAEEAVVRTKEKRYSCVLCDFRLPGASGLEFLKDFRAENPSIPFIIMTAFGSVEIAVDAMRHGANDFICKPFEPARLSATIKEVLEHRQIVDRMQGLRSRRDRNFLTKAASVERLLDQARRVAEVDSSILILGESGTGKELIARFIHEHSPRREKPFVAINCAALPPELLESEFFGHEAGSFTGATQTRIGVFEYASEGTIFLDEIGDMPAALQVKLLRVLQERELRRVGGTKTIKVNPRVISATNCNVDQAIKEKVLREDLFYRLAVISFTLPPLRDRPEDIEYLANHYMNYFSKMMGKPGMRLTESTLKTLRLHRWPGNARELENIMERAVILADADIAPEHLGLSSTPDGSAGAVDARSLIEISADAARAAEIEIITKVLLKTAGNKSRAAQLLGISYKTLLNKVREYRISSGAFVEGDDELEPADPRS